MANSVAINPLVIDTAGAGDILAANQPIKVQGFFWDNAAAVTADAVSVTDTAGNSIWSAAIVTSLAVGMAGISFAHAINVKGLKVPTLTRGKLYVYLAQEA